MTDRPEGSGTRSPAPSASRPRLEGGSREPPGGRRRGSPLDRRRRRPGSGDGRLRWGRDLPSSAPPPAHALRTYAVHAVRRGPPRPARRGVAVVPRSPSRSPPCTSRLAGTGRLALADGSARPRPRRATRRRRPASTVTGAPAPLTAPRRTVYAGRRPRASASPSAAAALKARRPRPARCRRRRCRLVDGHARRRRHRRRRRHPRRRADVEGRRRLVALAGRAKPSLGAAAPLGARDRFRRPPGPAPRAAPGPTCSRSSASDGRAAAG